MANSKKRSFRLSEVQAEVVMFAILFYLAHEEKHTTILSKAHRKSAEILYNKLESYDWEVTT